MGYTEFAARPYIFQQNAPRKLGITLSAKCTEAPLQEPAGKGKLGIIIGGSQTIQAFQQFFIGHSIVIQRNARHISISKSVVHCSSLVFNISMGIDQGCFQI